MRKGNPRGLPFFILRKKSSHGCRTKIPQRRSRRMSRMRSRCAAQRARLSRMWRRRTHRLERRRHPLRWTRSARSCFRRKRFIRQLPGIPAAKRKRHRASLVAPRRAASRRHDLRLRANLLRRLKLNDSRASAPRDVSPRPHRAGFRGAPAARVWCPNRAQSDEDEQRAGTARSTRSLRARGCRRARAFIISVRPWHPWLKTNQGARPAKASRRRHCSLAVARTCHR